MKGIKRLIASILAFAIMIGAAASPYGDILFGVLGGLPVQAGAEVITDEYSKEYGISYYQYFRYVHTANFKQTGVWQVSNIMKDLCSDTLNSRSDTDNGIAAFLTGIKDGSDIILTSIGSALGLTDSYAETCREASTLKFVENFGAMNNDLVEKAQGVSSLYSDCYKLAKTEVNYLKDVMIDDLSNSAKNLSKTEIMKMVNDAYGDYSEILSQIGDGVSFAETVIAAVALKDIELEQIRTLRLHLSDGELYEGLCDLEAKVRSGIVNNVIHDMVQKKAFETISSTLKKFIINGVTDGLTGNLASALVSLTVTLAFKFIDPVTAKDVIYSTYSYSYALSCQNAIASMFLDFAQYDKKYSGSSGKAVFERDIYDLRVVYNGYIAALKTCLQYTKKLAPKSEQYRFDIFINFIDNGKLCFDNWMKQNMEIAKEELAAGKFTIPSDDSSGSTTTITPEEQALLSAELVQKRFDEFQKKYPPNVGLTWTKSYRGGIQCFGFGRMFFDYVFSLYLPCYTSPKRYVYKDSNAVTLIGTLNDSEVTAENAKALFANAKLGDMVQVSRGNKSQHTMVFVSANESGITVYDCNWGNNCEIKQHTISYSWMANAYSTDGASEAGVSLYRASNYTNLTAASAFSVYDDSANYIVENGVLTSYTGYQSYIEIPETVTSIGDGAFKNNTHIRFVYMTDSVTSIGNEAFEGCTNLCEITFSKNINSIGYDAFYDCSSLIGVEIPSNVTEIASSTFYNCSDLSYVGIPDTVTNIGGGAFDGCSALNEITLPKYITTIGSYAFYGCTGLKSITIPKTLESCGAWIFQNTGITKAEIEDGATSVVGSLFSGCTTLEDVIIPDTVTNIGGGAFDGCSSLSSIDIPDSVTSIDFSAFDGCSALNEITLPKYITTIGSYAFYGCTGLKSITIPKTLESCGSSIFKNTCITKAEIEDGATSVVGSLFSGCTTLEDVIIPDTVTNIGGCAFDGCSSLSSIDIPDSVTSIGVSVFSDSGLKSIIIPEKITEINNSTFYNCTSLEKVDLPSNLRNIYSYAFNNCDSLESIALPNTVTDIDSSVFYDCDSLVSIEIPNSVTYIGDSLFYDCDALQTVKLPANLSTIYSGAFYDCDALTSITIPDSVTQIYSEAFYSCDSLSDIDFGGGVNTIGYSAFRLCPSLTKVELPRSLETVGENAFAECTKLTEVTIYPNTTTIPTNAFSYPAKTTVYGYEGTYAQEYAEARGMTFSALEPVGADSLTITIKDKYGNFSENAEIEYTGSAIKPTVKIERDGYTLIAGTDYEITSYENNTNAGTGIVNIAFKAMYTGVVAVPFRITHTHSYGAWTTTKTATCTTTGTKTRTCSKCGAKETQTINATGHKYSTTWTTDKAATCTTQGSKSHHCTVCGAKTDITAIPVTEHKYVSTVVKPTYTAQGYTLNKCSRCGNSYKDNYTDKLTLTTVFGLKLGGRASNALRLNWNKNTSANGYIIEQYKSGKWVRIAKISSNATTTYRVTGLAAGTAYKFRMRAYKMSGSTAIYSAYTSTFAARTNPSNVTGVKIGGKASNALRVNWTKNTSADGYIVEIYKSGKWVRAAKITKNTTLTYRISGLVKNTTYKIRIKAYKMSGSTALYSGYTTISGKTTA